MRVLCDCPEKLNQFGFTNFAWEKRSYQKLLEQDALLWRALGDGRPLYCTQLHTQDRFWQRLIVIENAKNSQFDTVRAILDANSNLNWQPSACLALTGNAFHGQRGRKWKVKPGNLFLTTLVSPQEKAQTVISAMLMLAVLAAYDAICQITPEPEKVSIKWINDLLIQKHKVGGVITSSQLQSNVIQSTVFGIGINLQDAPMVKSTPFVPSVTSLKNEGIRVELAEFLTRILNSFSKYYQVLRTVGFYPLYQDYCAASCVIGQEVQLWDEDSNEMTVSSSVLPFASGIVEQINEDLSLQLAGYPQAISQGRLAFKTRNCP